MGSVRYDAPTCEAHIACDGGEISRLSRTKMCTRCKDALDRRKRAARENARIEKLLKQAEIALPEDRKVFAGEQPRKVWNRRTRDTNKAQASAN